MTKCYYLILSNIDCDSPRIPDSSSWAFPCQGQGREPSVAACFGVTLWKSWLGNLGCFFASVPIEKSPFLQDPSRFRQFLGGLSFWFFHSARYSLWNPIQTCVTSIILTLHRPYRPGMGYGSGNEWVGMIHFFPGSFENAVPYRILFKHFTPILLL